MDAPEGGFTFADLWEAYESGARSARQYHPASDNLIRKSADAYCKSKAVRGPNTLTAEQYDAATERSGGGT